MCLQFLPHSRLASNHRNHNVPGHLMSLWWKKILAAKEVEEKNVGGIFMIQSAWGEGGVMVWMV